MDSAFKQRGDSCIEGIDGEWFVCVDPSSIDAPIIYSGGDIKNSGVHGPLESYDDAESWLSGYDDPELDYSEGEWKPQSH